VILDAWFALEPASLSRWTERAWAAGPPRSDAAAPNSIRPVLGDGRQARRCSTPLE